MLNVVFEGLYNILQSFARVARAGLLVYVVNLLGTDERIDMIIIVVDIIWYGLNATVVFRTVQLQCTVAHDTSR